MSGKTCFAAVVVHAILFAVILRWLNVSEGFQARPSIRVSNGTASVGTHVDCPSYRISGPIRSIRFSTVELLPGPYRKTVFVPASACTMRIDPKIKAQQEAAARAQKEAAERAAAAARAQQEAAARAAAARAQQEAAARAAAEAAARAAAEAAARAAAEAAAREAAAREAEARAAAAREAAAREAAAREAANRAAAAARSSISSAARPGDNIVYDGGRAAAEAAARELAAREAAARAAMLSRPPVLSSPPPPPYNPFANFYGNPYSSEYSTLSRQLQEDTIATLPGGQLPPNSSLGMDGKLYYNGTRIICYHPFGFNAQGTAITDSGMTQVKKSDGTITAESYNANMCWNVNDDLVLIYSSSQVQLNLANGNGIIKNGSKVVCDDMEAGRAIRGIARLTTDRSSTKFDAYSCGKE